jgi:hypothetical protein
MRTLILAALAAWSLCGCMPAYKLVKPGVVAVGDGSLKVPAKTAWNAVPDAAGAPVWEDAWTLNGPLLEAVSFVSGLPSGKALVKQRRKADAQVAVFRADMSPADLVSMIETVYRVGGVTVYEVDSVDPVAFLGGTGIKVRYRFSPGEGIGRRGSCVMRVVGQKLYLMKLEGVSSHYFAAAERDFDAMVAGAALAN